jgi:probable phosphomutase (TIGR03848 family)
MTLVVLVRHALTDATGKKLSGRSPGFDLSEAGREQAERLGERLRSVPIAAIYASPLERCMQTAEAVAAGRAVGVNPAPDLLEVEYGSWTGRSLTQLTRTKLWKQIQQAPGSIRFPGGESLMEAQQRAVGFLDELSRRHPRKVVVACSHADVIRLALAHYAGIHVDLFQRLIVGPASVSAVLLGDRIPRIVRMNDTGSAADLAPRRPAAPSRKPRSSGSAARRGPVAG